jgi:hypothetical protein
MWTESLKGPCLEKRKIILYINVHTIVGLVSQRTSNNMEKKNLRFITRAISQAQYIAQICQVMLIIKLFPLNFASKIAISCFM